MNTDEPLDDEALHSPVTDAEIDEWRAGVYAEREYLSPFITNPIFIENIITRMKIAEAKLAASLAPLAAGEKEINQ